MTFVAGVEGNCGGATAEPRVLHLHVTCDKPHLIFFDVSPLTRLWKKILRKDDPELLHSILFPPTYLKKRAVKSVDSESMDSHIRPNTHIALRMPSGLHKVLEVKPDT